MNKILRAVKGVFKGFFSDARIKSTLIGMVLLYGTFMVFALRDDMGKTRSILLENKKPGSVLVLDSVKHLVPYTTEKTRVDFEIKGIADFLLLSNGEINECFLTALFKLAVCLFTLKLIWDFDFVKPFDARYYDRVVLFGHMVIWVIFIEYFMYSYTNDWVYNVVGKTGFKYVDEYHFYYFLAYIWILQAFMSCYKTAVKTQQEAQLTI